MKEELKKKEDNDELQRGDKKVNQNEIKQESVAKDDKAQDQKKKQKVIINVKLKGSKEDRIK